MRHENWERKMTKILRDRTKKFAFRIIRLYVKLLVTGVARVIGKQDSAEVHPWVLKAEKNIALNQMLIIAKTGNQRTTCDINIYGEKA